MRVPTLAAALLLAAAPAAMANLTDGVSTTGRSPGPPLDQGPTAPAADRAYSGGGAVLEGAPGAPAPAPMQTAPAQSTRPQNMPAR